MGGHLDSVLNAANRLHGLIQEMLNFQYSHADESTLERSLVDFVELTRNVAIEKEMSAEASQHMVTLHLPDEPLWVKVDSKTMQVVLANLIGNAIKFTPEGGQIEINIARCADEVIFSVTDNGIGIPAEKLDRIFKRFYQVEQPMRRRYGGLGLGLSIAKELVELHQGRIWVESQIDKGSKFSIALKLAPQPEAIPTPFHA